MFCNPTCLLKGMVADPDRVDPYPDPTINQISAFRFGAYTKKQNKDSDTDPT